MRKVQFPHSGGDKSFGTNNVNNQKPNAAKKNNDLASALSGKSAPKFADATDAMEQLLADPTNESLRWEVMGFIKSSIPEDAPDVEEEDIVVNAEEAEATAQESEFAVVEGVEVKDPSDAMDKMLKGEISREGAMAYIKSTIPEGDIPYDD